MTPAALKSTLAPWRRTMETATPEAARAATRVLFAPDAALHLCHPFGDLTGPDALIDTALGPLMDALPDLERRDMIVVAGTTPEGADWIGCMGTYMGRFAAPFLGIPPTGRLAHMRYHEFFRLDAGRVTGMQAIWDIPELMMQAGAWPLAPQLGAFLATPGPMSGDGLAVSGDGAAAMTRVIDMLTDLCKHPADPDPASTGTAPPASAPRAASTVFARITRSRSCAPSPTASSTRWGISCPTGSPKASLSPKPAGPTCASRTRAAGSSALPPPGAR